MQSLIVGINWCEVIDIGYSSWVWCKIGLTKNAVNPKVAIPRITTVVYIYFGRDILALQLRTVAKKIISKKLAR